VLMVPCYNFGLETFIRDEVVIQQSTDNCTLTADRVTVFM